MLQKILGVKHLPLDKVKYKDCSGGIMLKVEEQPTVLAYELECGHLMPMSFYEKRPVNVADCPLCDFTPPKQKELVL